MNEPFILYRGSNTSSPFLFPHYLFIVPAQAGNMSYFRLNDTSYSLAKYW